MLRDTQSRPRRSLDRTATVVAVCALALCPGLFVPGFVKLPVRPVAELRVGSFVFMGRSTRGFAEWDHRVQAWKVGPITVIRLLD